MVYTCKLNVQFQALLGWQLKLFHSWTLLQHGKQYFFEDYNLWKHLLFLFLLFYLTYFYFMCIGILPAWMSVYHVVARQFRRVSDTLGIKL